MPKKLIQYRTKLTAFFLLAIVVSFLVGMYNYMSLQLLISDMTGLLDISQQLTAIRSEINAIQDDVDDYIFSRSSESLESFYNNYNLLSEDANQLSNSAEYTESGIKIKNLSAMLNHYLDDLDLTMTYKRGNQTQQYVEGNEQATKEYNYINNYIKEMMVSDLSNSAERYQEIQKQLDLNIIINYVLFGVTIVLIIILIFIFSYSVTKPISTLASYADMVSKGNFDVTVKEDRSSKEMNVLFNTFKMMIISIKDYVNEMQEKQKLKNNLAEEKINSLKMKNALNEAELTALQAQINPHFIFNTINIGSRIAMLQGDQVTCEYLEDTANVFRYNLKGLDNAATLQEEIDNVCSYIKLIITRFGDKIKFELNIDDEKETRKVRIPRMTLQPLIENAYIHGVSKNEDGGIIGLSAKKEKNFVYVTISNNGPPFSEEKIEQILNEKYEKKTKSSKGHTTGIGMDNVIKRLRIFFQVNDVLDISSNINLTEIKLKLRIQTEAILKENALPVHTIDNEKGENNV